MAVILMKQLLEAGVHFGHQTKRWNPKMGKFIFAERNGIHIIDLQKTVIRTEKAYEFIKETVKNGRSVLFVGTKKQAQEVVQQEAQRCNMFYVNQRWLGGMLTNFKTISKRIERMKEIESMKQEGLFEVLPKKEVKKLEDEHQKLDRNLAGIKEMKTLPGAVFVVDPHKEQIAIAEAKKLGIPVTAIIDTNCNPDEVDYPIPGNDDAIRAIKLITEVIANAVLEAQAESQAELKDEAPEETVSADILAESDVDKDIVSEVSELEVKEEI